jgi:two-component system sensor histidine kinase RpfC
VTRRPGGNDAPENAFQSIWFILRNLVGTVNRKSSEWNQGVIRVVIVGVVTVYAFAATERVDLALGWNVLTITSSYLAISLANLGSFIFLGAQSRSRRVVLLLGDLVVTTLAAYVGGESVTPFSAVYLWIIIGHGVRYGEWYLVASTFLGACGFGLVLYANPYWQLNVQNGLGLLFTIVVIPCFAFALVRQTRNSRELAEAASQEKSKFAADLSHDIRTGLSSISLICEMMGKEELTDKSRENVGLIRSAAETLLSVADDILDLAALEAGRFSVNREPVELYELTLRVMDTVRPVAESKGLSVCVVASLQMAERVCSDKRRLTQILLNLLSNAIKYTNSGRVCLIVSGRPNVLRFEVSDTGDGVPKHLTEDDVFGRFVRGHWDAPGVGLGLSIAYQLIQELSGRVGYHSNTPRGTTFWLEVPVSESPRPVRETVSTRWSRSSRFSGRRIAQNWLVPADEVPVAELVSNEVLDLDGGVLWVHLKDLNRRGAVNDGLPVLAGQNTAVVIECEASEMSSTVFSRGIWGVSKDLVRSSDNVYWFHRALSARISNVNREERAKARVRVLIAEDEAISETFLRIVLSNFGCEVHSVGNGRAAVEDALRHPPDVMFLDNRLPELNGIQVLQQLGDIDFPKIIVSADASAQAVESHLAAGATEYIVKPATADGIRAIIRKHVAKAAFLEPNEP